MGLQPQLRESSGARISAIDSLMVLRNDQWISSTGRRQLSGILSRVGILPGDLRWHGCCCCLGEILTNAWRHGEGPVVVSVRCWPGMLLCSCRYRTEPFDPDGWRAGGDTEEVNHRGILLLSRLSDRVEWRFHNHSVRVKFCCSW